MKASKRDIFIASLYIVAYMSTLTYAILSLNGTLVIMSTLLLGVVVYASYKIDKERKRYERLKGHVNEQSDHTIAEFEAWKSARG